MIRKALHMIMAAMVLVSTMGVTINMHYCHDRLIDVALYAPAESCCDTNSGSHCGSQEDLSQMNHCDNDSITIEALEDFVGSSLAIDFDSNQSTDLVYWIAWTVSSPGFSEHIKSLVPDYYFPPPYQEVDLSQIQSYLI